MKKKTPAREDPVVAEVRAIRAQMWEEAGGTIEGFLRLLNLEAHRRSEPSRRSSKKTRARRTASSR